jgi:hypothetical protein
MIASDELLLGVGEPNRRKEAVKVKRNWQLRVSLRPVLAFPCIAQAGSVKKNQTSAVPSHLEGNFWNKK